MTVSKQDILQKGYIEGVYTRGQGKAHACCKPHEAVFNCQMFGTFNVLTDANILDFSPSIVTKDKAYWFVKIKQDELEYFGWAIRDHTSRQPFGKLEILTKELLPDILKVGIFNITIYERWNGKTIRDWAKQQYWFQTFPFSPKKRADSEMLWNKINIISWSGMKVLDIGAHYGYFSFKASELGAQVVGVEPDKNSIQHACTIRDNIIHQDVQFIKHDPGDEFDVLFYLSVHHQPDPSYVGLKQKIDELKQRTKKHLFVELILPPTFPEGNTMDEKIIDSVVEMETLKTYDHRVRGTRRIYKWSRNEEMPSNVT